MMMSVVPGATATAAESSKAYGRYWKYSGSYWNNSLKIRCVDCCLLVVAVVVASAAATESTGDNFDDLDMLMSQIMPKANKTKQTIAVTAPKIIFLNSSIMITRMRSIERK